MASLFTKLGDFLQIGLTNTLTSSCSPDGWCNPDASCGSASYAVRSEKDVVVYAQTTYY